MQYLSLIGFFRVVSASVAAGMQRGAVSRFVQDATPREFAKSAQCACSFSSFRSDLPLIVGCYRAL